MAYVKRKYIGGEAVSNQLKSILPNEMKGVMFISGYRGKGKTTLAVQADFPGNICFFDFEDKGEGVHNQLKFGYYKAITSEENSPLERCELLLGLIKDLPSDKFTVAILDNITHLETGMQAFVSKNAGKYAEPYGKTVDAVRRDTFAAKRGLSQDLIGDLILRPLYAKGIKLVIATSHVKGVWDTPGKDRILGGERWQEVSILTLILIDGEHSPVPAAIVRKEQLALLVSQNPDDLTDDQIAAMARGEEPGHNIVRRLPYRMPVADFQHIRQYLHKPADLNNPAPGEELRDIEVDPFKERFTNEQISIQLLALETRKQEREEALRLLEAKEEMEKQILADAVRSLNGDSLPTIRRKIQQMIDAGELEYNGRQLTIADIAQMRG